MSASATNQFPRVEFRRRRFKVMAIALALLVCVVEGPPVRAHETGDGQTGEDHVHWGGTVEVDRNTTVTIGPGERVTYRLRLTEQPRAHPTDTQIQDGMLGSPEDGWWVRIRVDGVVRIDGDYEGIRWVPSVGWEFKRNNWNQWRDVTITAKPDLEEDRTFKFSHEVWSDNTYCPVHGEGVVDVPVVDRNGPRELDSVVSEIFLGFQAAKSR